MIVFIFSETLDSFKPTIQEAIAEFETRTCLKFVQRSSETLFIKIVHEPGWAKVFSKSNSPQILIEVHVTLALYIISYYSFSPRPQLFLLKLAPLSLIHSQMQT